MPIAMDSLAIIFIVVAATDSYALAGALTAVGSIVVGAAEVFLVPPGRSPRSGKDLALGCAHSRRFVFNLRSFGFKGCTDLDMVRLFNHC
jgi:hypothetical protein